MRRWFLSYHSRDEALAAQLKTAIEAKDPAAQSFSRGASARRQLVGAELAQEIADASAFLLIGESGSRELAGH